jgi:hypothetical protein
MTHNLDVFYLSTQEMADAVQFVSQFTGIGYGG